MKEKTSKEQGAWEAFKFITFTGAMVAFGCGGLTIIFIREFVPIMLLILIAPISFAIAWKVFAKEFLKDGVKP